MIFTSVDLPAPLSPTRATTSPGRMPSETSVRAVTPPKRCDTFLTSRMGGSGRLMALVRSWLGLCRRTRLLGAESSLSRDAGAEFGFRVEAGIDHRALHIVRRDEH